MRSKLGAMEMSMGTIVTIVLLMSVLLLGISFIGKIGGLGTSAIDGVDSATQKKINELFADENSRLVIYPASQEISLKKGKDPAGFGFSVMNDDVSQKSFTWTVGAEDLYDFETNCGSGMTKEKADGFILLKSKSFDLGPSQIMARAEVAKFQVPSSAPSCTIPYTVVIEADGFTYDQATIYVTFK